MNASTHAAKTTWSHKRSPDLRQRSSMIVVRERFVRIAAWSRSAT